MIDSVFDTEADREWFAECMRAAARLVFRRYGTYIGADDLQGEGWLWCYERPKRMRELLALPEGKERDLATEKAVGNYLVKRARKEKAIACGYEPQDEYFFSIGQLRDILPTVYDKGSWATHQPPAEVSIARTGDPAEGGGYLAMLLDVERAITRLRAHDRRVLGLRYATGEAPVAEVATALGITEKGAELQLSRALAKLRDELGGVEPYDDPPEYIGSRRVISNATAQAKLEDA